MIYFFSMNSESQPQAKQENALINIAFNVVIPVLILNKMTSQWGPLRTLVIALAFPLAYGIYDFTRQHKINYFSLLGFLNVLLTGGFALLSLSGIWFSLKEATFPLLIGLFVLFSAFGKKPFVKTLFFNPQLLHLDKIDDTLNARGSHQAFDQTLKHSTILLSMSFFVSAALNFILAFNIFHDLDQALDETQKAILLNEQIAKMTQWSFIVIMIPSMILLIFILWHLLNGIKKHTGLTTEEILKNN